MPRIRRLLAVLVAVLPLSAATKWDQRVEKAAAAVRAANARAPVEIRADSDVKAAEMLRATHPQLAWQFATAAAEELKAARRSGPLNQRLTAVLMALKPEEGGRIARELPDGSSAYEGLASYWIKQKDTARAAAVVKEAWDKGIYLRAATRLIASIRPTQPEEAAALFRYLFERLQPEKTTTDTVQMLIPAAQSVMANDPAAAGAALARLLDIVSNEKFGATGQMEMVAQYKLGDKTVETYGTRDSLLLPIGIYLHSLDSQLYEKNAKLFDKWRGEIAAVKPGEERKAATATRNSMQIRESLARRQGPFFSEAPRPAGPPKPTPFERAWKSVMLSPSIQLQSLLRRNDLTEAQRLQTARELLRIAPSLDPAQRVLAASAVLRTASDHDLKPVLKPAAVALAAALADLDKCADASCVDMRENGRALPSYDDLAAVVRQSHLHVTNPGVADRLSLLDLRDVLEENYDFKLPGIQGSDYALRAQKGRIVMLNFWATW
jgi:hypothetical protein